MDGGKVQVNGTRVKRSRLIEVGDEVRIRKPPYEYRVLVRGLSERRGPAQEAHALYEETPESLHAREKLKITLRHLPAVTHKGSGRPTKKERREIDRFRRRRTRDR